jgi:hypothetical protein
MASLYRFDGPGFVEPEGIGGQRLGPGFKLHALGRRQTS